MLPAFFDHLKHLKFIKVSVLKIHRYKTRSLFWAMSRILLVGTTLGVTGGYSQNVMSSEVKFGWEDDDHLDGGESGFDWDDSLEPLPENGPDQFDQRQILGNHCGNPSSDEPLACFSFVIRIHESNLQSQDEDKLGISALSLIKLLDTKSFVGETLSTYRLALEKLLKVCSESLKKEFFAGWETINPACYIQIINDGNSELYDQFGSKYSGISIDLDELVLKTDGHELSYGSGDKDSYFNFKFDNLTVEGKFSNAKYFIGSAFGGSGDWKSFPTDQLDFQQRRRFRQIQWQADWKKVLSDISKINLPNATGIFQSFKEKVFNVFAKPNLAQSALASLGLGNYVVDAICGEKRNRCGYHNHSEIVKTLHQSDQLYQNFIEGFVEGTLKSIHRDKSHQSIFRQEFKL